AAKSLPLHRRRGASCREPRSAYGERPFDDPTHSFQEAFMKTLLAWLSAVALLTGTCVTVLAADEKKLTPQQEKMKPCNAEAGDKKGDERKAFISQCLKAGSPAAPMTQQEKMKKCNADANTKSLKGDERKTFMSECLKGDKKS